MKTPEQIVNEWLNSYEWPYSERLSFSATELADAVEGLIEADRAQTPGPSFEEIDAMLDAYEAYKGDYLNGFIEAYVERWAR